MASIDEKTAYQEGNRIAMSYLQMTLMAESIFISASFAIFGLSFTIQNPTYIELFLMAWASVFLCLIFLIYNERYTRLNERIVFPMLRDIEQGNFVKFHTKIESTDNELKKISLSYYYLTRVGTWNKLGVGMLVVLWALRIFFLKTPP